MKKITYIGRVLILFYFIFYEGKLPALTIKLFDAMKEIKKEKFALHCIVSLKFALHCTVSNFLHYTISLLLMFLGWKLDSYCFASTDLAFWYLAKVMYSPVFPLFCTIYCIFIGNMFVERIWNWNMIAYLSFLVISNLVLCLV